jgi:hypothetical protein
MPSINLIAHIYQPELRHSANVRLDLKIIMSKNIQMQEQTSNWKWWLYGSVRFIVENEKQCHFRIEHCQNIYLRFPVPWQYHQEKPWISHIWICCSTGTEKYDSDAR